MSKLNVPSIPGLGPERERCDVVVLGGGPAGAAAAITLTRAGRSVVMLEKSQYDRARIGETLPPGARLPLARLGVWDQFIAAEHARSPGIVSVWGEGGAVERHFIFNPYGDGWHLDRQRFDAMLAGAASEAGARLCRGVDMTSCLPIASESESPGWQIEFGDGRKRHHLSTTFVIDATGRPAVLARRHGASRIVSDRLVGLAAVVPAQALKDVQDCRTLVEATDDGWWYSALLPGPRLIAIYMTDADLLPRRRGSWPAFWQARLRRTTNTKRQLRSFRVASARPSSPHVVAANSSRLDRMRGRGWLAVGDAAIAFDPLSSQGMVQALTAGASAGDALHGHLSGAPAALSEYDNGAQQTLRDYTRLHAVYYGRERRWPQSVFWQRRHAVPTQSETMVTDTRYVDARHEPAIPLAARSQDEFDR